MALGIDSYKGVEAFLKPSTPVRIKDMSFLSREDYENMTVDMTNPNSICLSLLINTVLDLQDDVKELKQELEFANKAIDILEKAL